MLVHFWKSFHCSVMLRKSMIAFLYENVSTQCALKIPHSNSMTTQTKPATSCFKHFERLLTFENKITVRIKT